MKERRVSRTQPAGIRGNDGCSVDKSQECHCQGFLTEGAGPTDKPGVVYQSSHKRRLSCPLSRHPEAQTAAHVPVALAEPLSVNRNQITCCLESDM